MISTGAGKVLEWKENEWERKSKRKKKKERKRGNERINLLRYHDLHLYIRKLFEKICLIKYPVFKLKIIIII